MKKIRVLAGPYVFSLTLTMMGGCWAAVIACMIMLSDPSTKWKSNLDKVLTYPTLFLIPFIGTCISLFWDTKWANVLVLSPTNIELRSCFKKAIILSYKEYPFIYRAIYHHSIVGAPDCGPEIVYAVLSRRRLSFFEQTHINQIRQDGNDVIKIKYSKKRYRLLLETLPPKMSRELERIFASHP